MKEKGVFPLCKPRAQCLQAPKCSGVGLVPEEKKAFLRTQAACRLGWALPHKEMLCFDISEKPQLAHWGGGQRRRRELVCGSTAEVPSSCQPHSGAADRKAVVPCPLCGAQGVWGYGQGWEQHSFPRAQLNGNRKIKGQERRKKVPSMLMCQLGN